MSRPQFPDPLGFREVDRPGATAHKAGPDALRRIQALEQGAAGRPGPGVSNGSVLTSDTTQTGGVKWQGAVGARARRTTTQSIPSGAWTSVSWNAADDFDTASVHDPVTNNTRLTPGVAGHGVIIGSLPFVNNGTGTYRIASILKNGTTRIAVGPNLTPSAANYSWVEAMTIDSWTATDYYEFQVIHDATTAINVAPDAGGNTGHFGITRTGSA